MRGTRPPPGWAGKVAAMDRGVATAGDAEYLLFTDADIAFPPDAVARLVTAAPGRMLVSQMVRLRAESFVTSTRSMIVLSRLVETPTPVPAPDSDFPGTVSGSPPS